MAPFMALFTLWLALVGIVPPVIAVDRKPKVERTALSHPCSRALSRTVRQRYTALAVGQLKRADRTTVSIAWPDSCPLNPLVDFFGLHEKNKSRTKPGPGNRDWKPGPRNTEWVCNYTGKIFKSEHYLDLHMEKYFSKSIPENGTCLADFCDIFAFCNVKEPSVFESLSSEAPPCDPMALAEQKAMCHSVNDRCAPPDAELWPGLNITKLNVDLHKKLCEQLTCEHRAENHFSNRNWSIFIGGGMTLACTCVFFYCMCVADKQADRDHYSSRRYGNTGKRTPFNIKQGGGGGGRPLTIPTKPLKQE